MFYKLNRDAGQSMAIFLLKRCLGNVIYYQVIRLLYFIPFKPSFKSYFNKELKHTEAAKILFKTYLIW